jgi:hypothetical protein
MRNCRASLIGLCLACAAPAAAQQVHANVGYAHIFRAGGFSFETGYLRSLSGLTSPVQQRVGADFWYANPDVASQGPGNSGRSLVGLGARYEIEVSRCCGRVHPLIAVPVQLLHSTVPDVFVAQPLPAALLLVPGSEPSTVPVEDESGSAWGWGAGVELGVRVSVGGQWNVQTSGTAMYQDIYARSTTNGAWTWHFGVSYGFGGGRES